MQKVHVLSSACNFRQRIFMKYELLKTKRCYVQSTEQDSLILLHVLFRHGQRTPTWAYSYPTDPHRNFDYYPFGQGQLTNEGKVTEYKLGQFMRNRYDQYLGKYYTPGIIEAWTTDFHRTQMSLQLFLAALYPPKDELVWNKELNWQPIPYNYVKRPDDDILQPCSFSARYKYAYGKYQIKCGILEEYKDVFKYLTEHMGKDVIFIRDVWKLMFTLKIQQELGLKLPLWTKDVWPKTILKIAEMEYVLSMGTPELRNIACGSLFRKILLDTKNKINNKSQKKFHIYSAHEANVARILISLDSFKPHVPDYGCCVIIEVHKKQNDYIVKVFYKSDSSPKLQLLKLHNENYCSFEKFTQLVESNFR